MGEWEKDWSQSTHGKEEGFPLNSWISISKIHKHVLITGWTIQKELEHRREMEILHYKNKIARIDMVKKGAITQLEDHRRKEESKVREKANKVRKTGKAPIKCFCFKSF